MIRSMTGFARRELAGVFGTLVCELRSVNHRFLDLSLRLPDSCRSLEPELRALLSRELRRGKVDATLQHRPAPLGSLGLDIDAAALQRVLERARELAAALPQYARVDVTELLRWPGVLREQGHANETLLEVARGLFGDTLAVLVGSREREGEHLSAAIAQRCTTLGTLVEALRARLPEARVRIRERFAERLREFGAQVDPERMEQEIALMLQRFDIDEEIDRLGGHLEETRRTLAAPEPAGRRLDFLMQELNREANTLSSKSQDLATTRAAVDMKVLIEQIREQVQNVE